MQELKSNTYVSQVPLLNEEQETSKSKLYLNSFPNSHLNPVDLLMTGFHSLAGLAGD